VPEEDFFWTYMVQGKRTEAYTPTIRMDATPSGLVSGPFPSSPPPFLRQMPFLSQPSHFSWLGTGTKYAGLQPSGVMLIIMWIPNTCLRFNVYFPGEPGSASSHLVYFLRLFQSRTSEDNWHRFLWGQKSFLSPNQQCQSTRGNG